MADALNEEESAIGVSSPYVHLAPAPVSALGAAADFVRLLARPQMVAQGVSVIDEDGNCIGVFLNQKAFEKLDALLRAGGSPG